MTPIVLPADYLASLDAWPDDDRYWRAVWTRAANDGALDGLRETLDRLEAERPDHWRPVWLRAELDWSARKDWEGVHAAATRCLEMARTSGDDIGVASCAYRAGWIDGGYRSDMEAADARFAEALDAAVRAGHDRILPQILNGRARIESLLGRYSRVLDDLELAAEGMRRAGKPLEVHKLDLNRGTILAQLGDFHRARQELSRTWEAVNAFAPRGPNEATTRTAVLSAAALALGNLEQRDGRDGEAKRWYARVPPAASTLAPLAALQQGRIRVRGDDPESARPFLLRARSEGLPIDAATAETALAELAERLGDAAAAERHWDEALRLVESSDAREAQWWVSWRRGRARLAAGDREAARVDLLRAVDVVDREGALLDPDDEGLRFLRERAEPYVDAARTELGPGGHADADGAARVLSLASRVRSRALRVESTNGVANRDPGEILAWLDLAPREALLDVLIGEDGGVATWIGEGRFESRAVPGWRALEADFRCWRGALTRPLESVEARLDPAADLARDRDCGDRLATALFGPWRDALEDVDRLWLVPDRDLGRLPWGALPMGDGWWADRLEIVKLPYVGPPPRGMRSVVRVWIGGDPRPARGERWSSLSRAAEELDAVSDVWRDAEIVRHSGPDWNENAVSEGEADRGFDLIHLASHAEASAVDPRLAGIRLSGTALWGFESIRETSLGNPWVVLSACATSEGETIPGEGVVGLSWAFLQAGADGVFATHWNVLDDVALEASETFHRRWAETGDPLRAARDAADALRRTRSHPSAWAAFEPIVRPRGPAAARGEG